MTSDADFLLAQIQDAQRERNELSKNVKIGQCSKCRLIGILIAGECRGCYAVKQDESK